MNKLIKRFLVVGIFGLIGFVLLSKVGTAQAAGAPFTCSNDFYQVLSGQLNVLDLGTTPASYTPIGSTQAFTYNAIGYNTLDNYIYGIVTSGGTTGHIIRVASDGTTTDLGAVSGLTLAGYVSGSFDSNGDLYINNGTTIYKITVGNNPANAASMTLATINTTGNTLVSGFDNVVIGSNLYTISGTTMSVVNLNTGVVTNVAVSFPAAPNNPGGAFGAGWTDQANELFFSDNSTGHIYQITNYNTNSPTATLKVTGVTTGNNDGASCNLAQFNPFQAQQPPVAANDSYSTPFNTTLDETTGSLLNNDQGASITVTSNTNPAHGSVVVHLDGTFVYTPNAGFSGTDSFNYTITDSANNLTASATVTIAVTADPTPTATAAPSTGFGAPTSGARKVKVIVTGILSASLIGLGLALRRSPSLARHQTGKDY